MTPDEIKEFDEKWGELAQHPLANGLKNWINSLLFRRTEEESEKMGKAIEMSKQGWIEEGESKERKRLWAAAKELHDKVLSGDYRKDIKDCKEKGCDHYIFGVDDFYSDLAERIKKGV